MKRRIAALVVVLIFSVSFCSKGAGESDKSLLWEISGPDEKSYILGSIHVFKEEWYPLRDIIEESFVQSDVLVLETDLSKGKQEEHAALMMKLGLYQGDETLEKNISKEAYRQAKKLLKQEYNLDIKMYDKFKPWYLSLLITLVEVQKMGYNPEFGIDQHFYKKALGKKEIIGLESIELYIKVFGEISKEDQEKFMDYTMKDLRRMRKDLKAMLNMWVHGDLSGIEQLNESFFEENADFLFLKTVLLDDRNKTMGDRIIDLMGKSDKTFFFVVGAAHLYGETGILKILKKSGYTLKQL